VQETHIEKQLLKIMKPKNFKLIIKQEKHTEVSSNIYIII